MAELIETGDEPEFNITDLAWWEPMAGGALIRLCFANRKHGRLVAQYTVVLAMRDFGNVMKACAAAATDTDPFAWISEDALAH